MAVVFGGFYYKDELKSTWVRSITHYFPCKTNIEYNIGGFDTRFGISKTDFLSAIKEAEAIWEKPINKDLFSYSENGNLKINLIYDTRQETTVELQKMGLVVKSDKASFDALKSKYNAILSQYNKEKSAFDARVQAFESRKKIYEAEVISFNKKGGASKTTVSRLNTEKQYLENESINLISIQNDLNTKVENINALVVALNQLATTLNINVRSFNEIGDNLGGEFNEGLYKSGPSGEEIDIYQFENRTKLVRVLAHELGHALGLDHNEDSKAIMYRLNNGVNEKLTETDLVELKTLCKIK